ncbi:MAG: PIN domain-containing protein [Bacteroidetes bacterium]|nr:PIN domain-containing protein [Bacteroidota bacterium]
MTPSRTVFADAFYWVALINPKDSSHHWALRLSRSLQNAVVVTTEEVFTEVLAYFSGRGEQLRSQAARDVRDLLRDPAIRVVPQSHESFLAGLKLYEARLDKDYSLTDCISMNVLKAERITDVLTNDEHFTQEGFRALFRA